MPPMHRRQSESECLSSAHWTLPLLGNNIGHYLTKYTQPQVRGPAHRKTEVAPQVPSQVVCTLLGGGLAKSGVWRPSQVPLGPAQVRAKCQPGANQVPPRCQPGANQVPPKCKPGASQVPVKRQPSASQVPTKCEPSASHAHRGCASGPAKRGVGPGERGRGGWWVLGPTRNEGVGGGER